MSTKYTLTCGVCGCEMTVTPEDDAKARAESLARGETLVEGDIGIICDPCWQHTKRFTEALGGDFHEMLRTGPSYWDRFRLRRGKGTGKA